MTTKNTRLDIRTTTAAKDILEHAADLLGTTLSAFMLDSSMSRAREIVAQSEVIRLTRREAERFAAALETPPKANEKLKQLFEKYNEFENRRIE